MTQLRHLVVHVSDSPRTGETARFAAALAAEHGARLTALYAVEPVLNRNYLTAEGTSLVAGMIGGIDRERRDAAIACVHDAIGPVPVEIALGDPYAALRRAARASDLLVLGQRSPGEPDGTTDALAGRLITTLGTPIMLVPYIGCDTACGVRRVLVAWTDTAESTRALRDAIPLLARAEEVELIRFVPADAALNGDAAMGPALHYLASHGVLPRATLRHASAPGFSERMRPGWLPDASVAEALLSHAADTGADLIVMGGYGHSRAWEMMMGGVTRAVLGTMTVPVLMSH